MSKIELLHDKIKTEDAIILPDVDNNRTVFFCAGGNQ